jgi:hypothetical protein
LLLSKYVWIDFKQTYTLFIKLKCIILTRSTFSNGFKDRRYVPQFQIIFRENLPTVCLYSILFSQQNWGYLSRHNLELGILIISGCSKKTVYQYEVVAKMKYMIAADHGSFTLVGRCPNHYATDDHDVMRVKLIQYKIENLFLKKTSSNEGGRNLFLK